MPPATSAQAVSPGHDGHRHVAGVPRLRRRLPLRPPFRGAGPARAAGGRPARHLRTVTFPPATPPPAPREKHQTPHQLAKAPIHVHVAPVSLDTGPTPEVPTGPPGAGSGEGFGQWVPTPPTPAPTVVRPKTILNPDWIHKPSGAQLADAYPDRALERGVAGSAILLCAVGVKGEVRDCRGGRGDAQRLRLRRGGAETVALVQHPAADRGRPASRRRPGPGADPVRRGIA
ncbi:MAG: hypothetical protein WDN45_08270 [Caulobacteraceae bacterium]